jgi:CRISPR-associated protein Csm2
MSTNETDIVDQAEQVILRYNRKTRDYKHLTTSKLRNILSMITDIYNDVRLESNEKLSENIQERIRYLRIRLVYECGREPYVIKPFEAEAGLLSRIQGIGCSRAKFIEFVHYMEALVAYHRFHGGHGE